MKITWRVLADKEKIFIGIHKGQGAKDFAKMNGRIREELPEIPGESEVKSDPRFPHGHRSSPSATLRQKDLGKFQRDFGRTLPEAEDGARAKSISLSRDKVLKEHE